MRKSVAAVVLVAALLGPAANAGAQAMQVSPVAVPAGSSSTGSAEVLDPLLCAPVIGTIIQALGYNPYGPLLGQICAMR
ncbi:hypothetical protein [Nocardia shimofusensis]|uniref:hypothetical protein n=1 Tax=Nocardia shimofusensis TaxID=228596 RepID=UPI00082D573E|nr:hypothetical protein [Nocardia shimofusensis]